jgi:hypothetical protein
VRRGSSESPTTTSQGSVPFGVSSSGDRHAGLPLRRLPLSGFLTLSAVSSRPGLVALFRATSALRVSAFRAFPARPAVTPSGVLCSPAVGSLARPSTSEPCSDRASVPDRTRLGERPGRCSPDLCPLRGPPARPLGSRPPLVCLLRPRFVSPEEDASPGLAALQGLDPAEPGSRSRDRLRPPWGLRPHPLPLAPSGASGLPAVSFARASRKHDSRSRRRGVTLCAVARPALATSCTIDNA